MASSRDFMNDVEEAHRYFRGCAEVGKRFVVCATICDLIAALIAVHGLISTSNPGVALWRPFVAFISLLAAAVLRGVAEFYKRFAQKCRRISSNAYALGHAIPPQIAATLRSDVPMWAPNAAIRLPAQSVAEYYEPSRNPGEARLREMTAHSSFYTWRLLRSSIWLYGSLGAIIVIVTAILLYRLAIIGAAQPMDREAALDGLFSVVLGFLAVRAIGHALSCWTAANAARRVADRLIEPLLPSGAALFEIVKEYDMERLCSPVAPTPLYILCRRKLSEDWKHRRQALEQTL